MRQLKLFPERELPKKRGSRRLTKQQKDEAAKRRKDREENAPGRGVTKEDRRRVWDFYGRRCLACGFSKGILHLDHVVPLAEGGRHDIDNLAPLCIQCNRRKGTKTIDYRPFPIPEEWQESVRP